MKPKLKQEVEWPGWPACVVPLELMLKHAPQETKGLIHDELKFGSLWVFFFTTWHMQRLDEALYYLVFGRN